MKNKTRYFIKALFLTLCLNLILSGKFFAQNMEEFPEDDINSNDKSDFMKEETGGLNEISADLGGSLVFNNPSPYVSDWKTKSSTVVLTVINSKRNMKVSVEVRLKKNGQEISDPLSGKIKYIKGPDSPKIPSVTTIYTIDDIADWGNLKFKGEINNIIITTGRLPEGTYEGCVYIKETDPPLTPASLTLCANFVISLPQAPRLVSPTNSGSVAMNNPVFSWMVGNIPAAQSNIQFRLKIVDMLKNETPQQAFNSNRVFYQEVLSYKTSYPYPVSATMFQKGTSYAWQVQMLDSKGNGYGENNGKSEIWAFTRKDLILEDTTKKLLTAPDKLILNEFEITVNKNTWKKQEGQEQKYYGEGTTKFKNDSKSFTVRFRDITLPQNPGVTVTPTGGSVHYSNSFQSPVPKFTLITMPDNFGIEMDSLVIITGSGTKIKGFLRLPGRIISANGDEFARLEIPLVSTDVNRKILNESINKPYGPFFIGETEIIIEGGTSPNYRISFSGTGNYAMLLNGVTKTNQSQNLVVSNKGYVKGNYTFENLIISNNGAKALLKLKTQYTFRTLEPYSYDVQIQANSVLNLEGSEITSGTFNGSKISLPFDAVRSPDHSRVKITMDLKVDRETVSSYKYNTLVTSGTPYINLDSLNFIWGEFTNKDSEQEFYKLSRAKLSALNTLNVNFFLHSLYKEKYYATATPSADELKKKQGMSFYRGEGSLSIYTPDIPSANIPEGLKYDVVINFINVMTNGVNAGFHNTTNYGASFNLGPTHMTDYEGDKKPFDSRFYRTESQGNIIYYINFVESCVYDDGFSFRIKLDMPIDDSIKIKNMHFTSTSNCVGGEAVMYPGGIQMKYWGVKLEERQPPIRGLEFGVLSAKKGKIYILNGAITEKIHYLKPFDLNWAEIKSSGDIGKLFFDYSRVNRQKFDNFPYPYRAVDLSQYDPQKSGGYLHTFGTVETRFFGPKDMDIHDWKYTSHLEAPYKGRNVSVNWDGNKSNLVWQRGWGLNDIHNINYNKMDYNTDKQWGFKGMGYLKMANADVDLQSVLEYESFLKNTPNSEDVDIKGKIKINSIDYFDKKVLTSLGSIKLGTIIKINEGLGGEITNEKLDSIYYTGKGKDDGNFNAEIIEFKHIEAQTRWSFFPGIVKFYRYDASLQVTLVKIIELTVSSSISEYTFNYKDDFVSGKLTWVINGDPTASDGETTSGKLGPYLGGSTELGFLFGENRFGLQGRLTAKYPAPPFIPVPKAVGFFVGYNVPNEEAWLFDEGKFGSRIKIEKNQISENGYITGLFIYCCVTMKLIGGSDKDPFKIPDLGLTDRFKSLFLGLKPVIFSVGFVTTELRVDDYIGIGLFKKNSCDKSFVGTRVFDFYGELLYGMASFEAWVGGTIQGNPCNWKDVILIGRLGINACLFWQCLNLWNSDITLPNIWRDILGQ